MESAEENRIMGSLKTEKMEELNELNANEACAIDMDDNATNLSVKSDTENDEKVSRTSTESSDANPVQSSSLPPR